ncbi:type IX secretion system sortase PorU [Algoriphagus terrigena]|uniref:type IX secretion system sortase PorU n=1 Tax=Algoriphagus terrigena TaxID=344884 RepID=UPI0004297465|nr:type IX secretion system sortase PorU [Algoriphagus terrigena]
MRKAVTAWAILLIFGFLSEIPQASAQSFQFKVSKQGVYKVSASQAADLGFASLSDISVFGYPGMLPQKLDSVQLSLQEIPALESDGNLYFFLPNPNMTFYSSEGLTFSPHLFEDSLSFLIGKKETPLRLTEKPADPDTADPNEIWYSFTGFHADKTNLLNSGRSWYSDPIRSGQSLNINLGLQTATDHPWVLQGALMAQSYASSTMRVLTGNELFGEVTFSPIPNSTYGVKGREEVFGWTISPGNSLAQLRFTFQGSGAESAGYLNYVIVGVPFSNSALTEGIFESTENQKISISPNFKTWEVSDFFNPIPFNTSLGKSALGKKWIVFSHEKTQEITEFKPVSLSLRILAASPDLMIITSPSLLSSANKLRDHKRSRGLETLVVTTTEIYESFGYGNRDITAIRNFIAAVYHAEKRLKNVLILGKGTFDYKGKLGGRPNLVPTYSSRESLNPLTTFSSDDYFGLVDWGQGFWEESREGDELLQIGVGRLPAINFDEANEMVEKIIRYETHPVRTPKSSTVTFLADDGDNNIHVRDAESLAGFLSENHQEFLQQKLYLDRFDQESAGENQQSPQAKSSLQKTLDEGTLILNFIGHGNETTLTAEEVFRVEDLADWPMQEQLALWVSATCEFGRHDSPFIRSAAEELLAAKGKGAVALLTTGRPVFSSVNFSLNKAFIEEVFEKKDGRYQDLGEIFKTTKNNSLNGSLNRNFSLLGDPSLTLALPDLEIKVTSIEDGKTGIETDTLSAFQQIRLTAEVLDPLTQSLQSGFQGEYQIELRDKPVQVRTLGDESNPYEFSEEKTLIFKGTGKIESGKLEASFLIPKGIDPEFGNGNLRIRGWDVNSGLQAMGSEIPVMGGSKADESTDTDGPEINLVINGQTGEPFVFPTPNLQIEGLLFDESGINVSGFIAGQDLSIQVNDQPPTILNEEYLALEGGYQKGLFNALLSGFTEGKNTITVTAWDNAGNEQIRTFEVEIKGSDILQILDHKVYPNPASVETHFEISHNRQGENLLLSLTVYSLTGQILFQETFRLQRAPKNIGNLSWSFLQSQTKYPAKGTYIYKLTLQSESDFNSDSVSGKLVIQ